METVAPQDDSALLDFLHLLGEDESAGVSRTLGEYLQRFPDAGELVEKAWLERKRAAAVGPVQLSIGPYRVVRELGRGGQSIVYLAEDTRLPRRVALKVLRTPFDSVMTHRKARLRREAESIARIDHPNLCTILEAELDHDPPYFAMRFVDGPTLAQHIALAESGGLSQPRDSLALRRALQFFERAALALHVAHETGIVHRDIKPANVMIDERQEPVIVDFGLALAHAQNAATLTRTHEAVGTPAYMAPEQLRSSAEAVDRRCDVYALGVTMYECLTARRPFEADGSAQLIEAITSAPLPDARAYNETLPSDVCVVLATALERDLGRRYRTALDLADDLRRILEYRPIAARPAGLALQTKRWMQRHPALAGTIGVLLAGLLVALYLLRERQIVADRLQGAKLATLSLSMVEQDPTRALLLAIDSARIQRDFYSDSALVAAMAQCRERLSIALSGRAVDAALSPDGKRAALACDPDDVVLVDLDSGAFVGNLRGRAKGVVTLAYSPDGRHLLTGSMDSTACLWRADTLELEHSLSGHTDGVRRVAFSPDGTLAVTTSDDGTARVWNVATGELAHELRGHEGLISNANFSPDGSLLVTSSGSPAATNLSRTSDRTARIWDPRSGASIAVLRGHASFLRDARFTRDGEHVVTGSDDGTARYWDAKTGELLATRTCPGPVHCTAPSPTGEWIAVAHETGALLWRVGDDRTVELAGHLHGVVRSAEFDSLGARVVTGADDRTARIWSVPDGRELATLRRADHRVIACRWSADDSSILTTTWTVSAHLWYAGRLPGIDVLAGPRAPVESVRVAASSAQLLSASRDGELREWTGLGNSPHSRAIEPPGAELRAMAASATGERAIVLSLDGRARVHDLAAGRSFDLATSPRNPWRGVQLDRRGERAMSWSDSGDVQVVEVASERVLANLRVDERRFTSAALSDDGARVACGCDDGSVRVWSVEPPELVHTLPPPSGPRADLLTAHSIAWSHDGARLAVAHRDRSVEFFESSGRSIARVAVSGTPDRLAFSNGGESLMIVPRSNPFVTVLDGHDGHAMRPVGDQRFDAHVADVTCGAFSPDGSLVVTGSYDGTARLWNTEDGSRHSVLDARAGTVLDVAFTPDGTRIVTAHADGSVRLWPVDPLPGALARRPREWTEQERARYLEAR